MKVEAVVRIPDKGLIQLTPDGWITSDPAFTKELNAKFHPDKINQYPNTNIFWNTAKRVIMAYPGAKAVSLPDEFVPDVITGDES